MSPKRQKVRLSTSSLKKIWKNGGRVVLTPVMVTLRDLRRLQRSLVQEELRLQAKKH